MKMFLLSFNAFKHRSIFAVFLAIFLLFGAVKGTKAQESNGSASAFDGLENLKGISAEQMKTYASEGKHGEFPTTDKNKIFFLYNVKTDLLLNVGGYWGTHVSLQEYGMPLWVYKDTDGWIHFQQDIDKQGIASANQEGCSLEYFYGEGYASTSIGVFVDRDIYASKSSSTVIQRGWTIEPIKKGDTKNTFRIYTYRRSANGYSKYKTYDKYYLSAAASQGDVDKNCGAFPKTDNDYSDEGSKWRIFSYKQLYDLQTNSIGFKSSLDLSFKLECPGFNRDNGALDKWTTAVYKKGTTGSFRFGLEKRYKTDPKHVSYDYTGSVTSYTFNGTNYTSIDDYQTHLGKYYCADIKNTRGAVYQVVHVDHGGSYVIECKAYSNTNKAKLFAVLLQDKSEKPTDYTKIVEGSLRETVVMQTANMSQTEQTNLHISEQNMDYAGKEFYGSHKYFNSVLVQVPEGGGNICFGVRVGSVADNVVESNNEWTVFDDFRLLYAGSTTSRDLILDEDKDNLNYLLHCTETYDDVVLHLNKKSFNKNINKWNTIVLPVDLNKDQFTQAFGANARLAELKTLTRNQIQFETVKIADKGNNDVVLAAYVPYIIYPTKDLANEKTPEYTATLHKTGTGSGIEEHKVTIAANHIDIPNVSLKRNDQNKNDLFGLIKDTWSLDLNHVKLANKTEASEIVTDGTLAAYGTFARTYGSIMKDDEQTTFTVDKGNPIISGRDDLKGCYFFHEGKMVYAGDKVRGLRGFSVWFKPVETPASGAATSKFILDGIDYTTDVERIMATEDSSIDSKFAKLGVFNLNGQLVRSGSTDVSGLPSGIYIVNGKKVFVK